MKKAILLILLQLLLAKYSFAQENYEKIKINDDLEVIKISDNVYVHISYATLPKWGRMPANGVIYINSGEAVLLDTPWNDDLTKALTDWITASLKVKIAAIVPNHWHEDCMGGLSYLHSIGIKSYANELTAKIAKEKGLPVPQNIFSSSISINVGKEQIICSYFGAAHTLDNIVVWIPKEKILFAGCMAKEMTSENLGNTVDGDLKEYPGTIKKVLEKYYDAKIVIPGHGKFGGIELLKHTLELALKNNQN